MRAKVVPESHAASTEQTYAPTGAQSVVGFQLEVEKDKNNNKLSLQPDTGVIDIEEAYQKCLLTLAANFA